ncbi:MAG: terminase large subunit [Candidatus Moranbacteria bacterium]|nr:terminase large subunit [Candidatus Moranbacteria bacterium]
MTKIKPITREKLIEYKKDIVVFLEEQYILENGKPIVLQEFQKKILRDIFQTKDKNGLRKYNLALVGIPKKNGKSTLASGIALYMLFADVSNAEVYSVAGDKDQAKIIFQMTKRAIERNPILLDSVKIYKDEIVVPSTGSIYKVLSADAPTLHGL